MNESASPEAVTLLPSPRAADVTTINAGGLIRDSICARTRRKEERNGEALMAIDLSSCVEDSEDGNAVERFELLDRRQARLDKFEEERQADCDKEHRQQAERQYRTR